MKGIFVYLLILGLTSFSLALHEKPISLIEEMSCRDKRCGTAGKEKCATDFKCQNGKCKKTKVKCKGVGKNAACQSDEVCSWGQCQLEDKRCKTKSDCGAGQTCQKSQTFKIGSRIYGGELKCQYNDQVCRPKKVTKQPAPKKDFLSAVTKKCFPKKCGAKGNDKCSAGFECKNGECKKKEVKCRGVGKSSACQSDEVCSWGACVLQHKQCKTKKDCGDNQTCKKSPSYKAWGHVYGGQLKCYYTDEKCENIKVMVPKKMVEKKPPLVKCREKKCGTKGKDTCSAGFECHNGGCKRKEVKCRGVGKSSACQSDEACSWGFCGLVHKQCKTKKDCGDNQTCRKSPSYKAFGHVYGGELKCYYSDEICTVEKVEEIDEDYALNLEQNYPNYDDYEDSRYSGSQVVLFSIFGLGAGIQGAYYINRRNADKQ